MVALVKDRSIFRARGAAGASGALLVFALTGCGRSPFDDVATGPRATGPAFQPLPLPPDCPDGLVPTDLSDDGLVVVGNCTDTLALRWSVATGYEEMPVAGQVRGTDGDGSVLVGSAGGSAFLLDWPSRTVTMLGGADAIAHAVSSDGTIAVGESTSLPCVWNHHGNPWFLGGDIGDGPSGWTAAVSADGRVLAGQAGNRAFRYTETSGMADLGRMGNDSASARAISRDGNTVVGVSSFVGSPPGDTPFAWMRTGGMFGLSKPADCTGGIAVDVSDDGTVVAIQGHSCTGPADGHRAAVAIVYSATSTVEEVVRLHGGDLAGWSLSTIVALSADGRIALGAGEAPDGKRGAWLARID